jgi:flagellar biosynthesis protein FlhG
VAGAKGGTGKSMIAANIGVFLATLGKEVVLVDAAFGGATLHSFVGVAEPNRTLADFFSRKDAQLEEVLISTLVSNLRIVSGEKDPAWAANPRLHQLQRLRDQIRELDVDYVVIDLSPGTRENILDLFLDADTGIVVSSAEPTAVEMSYRLIKAAFVRSLRRSEMGFLGKMSVEEARECEGGIPAPSDLLARAITRFEEDSEEVAALREHMERLVPYLVLNFARSKADMDLGKDIAVAATRRFGVTVPYLGPVEYDDAVWVSLRRRRPLLVEHPESRASKCVEKLTRRLLAMESESARKPELPGDSLYDLLEVEPTASEEAIRRANRRITQIYAKDSVVVGGLYRPARLEKMHRQLEHAYDTLMNPAKRRVNDAALFPDGMPSEPRPARASSNIGVAPIAADRPDPPSVDEDTVFSGKLLQLFREARGFDLREIADHTKIGMSYLNAIEQESYADLPAIVYVRGFLMEYAKMLDLDVPQVLDTYLSRIRQAQGENLGE